MRLFLALVVTVGLGIVSWGVGGCGGGAVSNEPSSLSDFDGEYSLRDHSCTSALPQSFRLIDSSGTVTIIDPGSSIFTEGDVFSFDELTDDDGTTVIQSDTLGCIGGFVDDEESAQNLGELASIDTDVFDLFIVCTDSSADGECAASYSH